MIKIGDTAMYFFTSLYVSRAMYRHGHLGAVIGLWVGCTALNAIQHYWDRVEYWRLRLRFKNLFSSEELSHHREEFLAELHRDEGDK